MTNRVHDLFDPPDMAPEEGSPRRRVYEVIFRADSRAGRAFDVFLLAAILASVCAVMAESVTSIAVRHGHWLRPLESALTTAFVVEYVLRAWCVRRPVAYMTSFFGLIDLVAIAPAVLNSVVEGTQAIAVVRVLRLLRVFRLLRLHQFVDEAELLTNALVASSRRIAVFLGTVVGIICIFGAVMYVVEGPESGFDSIPRAMYWAVVTVTTVGYGDIAPRSALGQMIAAIVMVLGYAILAVPTGIVSAEIVRQAVSTRQCGPCGARGHASDARFCRACGAQLEGNEKGKRTDLPP